MTKRYFSWLTIGVSAALVLGACGEQGQVSPGGPGSGNPPITDQPDTPTPGNPPSSGDPAGASQVVKLKVPAGMSDERVNANRELKVPAGYEIAVYARIPKARFMAVAPGGDVLVSQPSTGSILRVTPNGNGAGTVSTFASGLSKPHDMVFKTFGGTTYLYVSESNRVTRSEYVSGDSKRRAVQTVVSGLPDSNSSGELRGNYGHELKNFAIDDAGRLYLSVASASNASPELDPRGIPVERAAIHVYDATKLNQDASTGKLFARGIRNAEGLAFAPGTNDLWAVVMNRDNILYPHQNDYDGDGTNDYKDLIPDYVDKNPPEEIVKVQQGDDYGWPFCNPDPRAGLNNMPYLPDVENNEGERVLDCDQLPRVEKGMQAHSAPLGVTFWKNGPGEFENVMTVGLHGCWNCQEYVGYKVAFFPLKSNGTLGEQRDLVTGWITNPKNPGNVDCGTAGRCWGRPVDMADMPDGSLLISDDFSGTIYRLSKKQ